MSRIKTTSVLSRAAIVALAAGLVGVPQADAETKTNLNQPLACNLQLKNPGAIPLGQASAVEGVYNAANKTYNNFQISLQETSAPDTVEKGQEFDYVIDAGTIGVPSVIKAAVTANVSRVSQLNLWYELPENAEYVSHTQEGGLPGMKVEKVGNKLRIWIPEGEKGSVDVTRWSKNTRGDFAHGGAEATRGTLFDIAIPKVTIKLKATGEPGSTIQAGFPKVDADTFSPELPIQFYADAAAKFGLINIAANGFIRCGLSEDDTYWPRDKNGTNLPSTKFSAVKITAPKPQNETNSPKAKGAVTITEGDALPKAEEQVADFAKLPAGTTAAWASEHTTVGDNQAGKITVTYPDKTTDTVAIAVNVKKKADNAVNDPKAKGAVTITEGDALPKAEEQVADFAKLPAGTTAAWASEHTTVGDNQAGKITVTYPDKTTDIVDIRVDVAAQWAPQGDPNPAEVKVGATISDEDAKARIVNAGIAPEGTTFEWKTKPDTATANEDAKGVVTVHVPNRDEVDVEVHYIVTDDNDDTWRPQVTADVQNVEKGTELSDEDAKALVTNLDADNAPSYVKVAWKTKPDTTKAGAATGVITISAGEGEDAKTTERRVSYNVIDTFEPEAKQDLTVEVGTEVDEDAAPAIANADAAPFGTEFKWTQKPDTSKLGQTTGTVEVSGAGQQPVTVTVTYKVTTNFEPAKNETAADVAYGTDTTTWAADEVAAQIQNADEAPAGTTFEWVTKPTTTAEGKQVGKVRVTVPGHTEADAKVSEIDVDFNVLANFTPVAGEGLSAKQNDALQDADAEKAIRNAADAPEGTTYAWKAKPNTDEPGEATGVVTVTVPGQDPVDVTVSYTVEKVSVETPETPENPNPETPENPNPETPAVEDNKLTVTTNGQAILAGKTVNFLAKDGQYVGVVADANGAVAIPKNRVDVQTFTVNDVVYTVDLGKKTFKKEMGAAEVAGTVIGSVLATVGLLGTAVQLSGIATLNTDIQKQLGIFNPQIAAQVERAMPAVSGVAGLIGLGLVIGLLVPKKGDNAVVKVGEDEFKFAGYTFPKKK